MRLLTVDLPGREYGIHIERGALDAAGALLRAALPRAGKVAVVTDSTVGPLYGERVLASLRGAGLEPKRLRLAQHGPDTPPFAALVEAVRQGREGLAVLPTLVEHP